MSLPSYLKSLEQVLGTAAPTPAVPAAPVTPATPATPVVQSTLPSPLQSTPTTKKEPPKTKSLPTFLTASQLVPGLVSSQSSKDKLKVLMVGTHCHQVTGYSKVTYGLIRQMAKQPHLQVVHYGFQKHPQLPPNYRIYPPNVRVIDAAATEQGQQGPGIQGFGYAALPETIRQEKPDVVFIYNDMVVISRFLEEIRKSGVPRTFKIWLYVDQVYNCQLQMHLDTINRDADRVFVFSSYWRKCLKDQGITRPIDVLEHGFEESMFPMIKREEARKRLNLPAEGFVFLSLNRNQPRKRYDLLLMAFVELIAKYPTKPLFLMCVCDKGEKGGWPIFEVFTRELRLRGLGVDRFGGRLMLTSQDMMFSDDQINLFYNMADVGVCASDGEGWGLCHFEQMGVGVPQVVPDIGGFKAFCTAENSVLVKPTLRSYQPLAYCPVAGENETCDAHAICLGMEEYVLDSEKRKKHGEAARARVLEFTWPKVTEILLKRLKSEHEEKMEAAS